MAWETNYLGEVYKIYLLGLKCHRKGEEEIKQTHTDVYFSAWQKFAESLISWWGMNKVAVQYSTFPAETRSNSDCTVNLSITKVFPRRCSCVQCYSRADRLSYSDTSGMLLLTLSVRVQSRWCVIFKWDQALTFHHHSPDISFMSVCKYPNKK